MVYLTAHRFALIMLFPCVYVTFALANIFFGETPFISLSVLLFVGVLAFSLLITKSRYSLYNPLFVFCVFQLTLYSFNWIPFLFSPTLVNDTFVPAGLSSHNVMWTIVVLNLLQSLWLFFAVLGSFLWKFKPEWRAADVGHDYRMLGALVVAISIFSFVVLVAKAGSISELMLQRQIAREDRLAATIGRHWFAFAQIGILGVALCAFSDKRFFKSLYFLPSLAAVLTIGFIVAGNRTMLVLASVVIYFAWLRSSKKIVSPALIVGVVVLFMALGGATKIRENGFTNFQSLISEPATGESNVIKKIFQIKSERAVHGSSSLGVLMAIDSGMPYLFGQSLKSIAYITVPSVLLSSPKPPAAGKLAAETLAGRTDTAWPISPVVEAYWNFGVFGVIFSGLIYGLLSSFIYRVMLVNPDSPILLVGYSFFVTTFAISSDGFYKFFHLCLPLIAIYILIKLFFWVRCVVVYSDRNERKRKLK